ncbi:Hybrid signal transduction histidine kinase K [Lachnellula occidentalis]|uniref:histidine kinase n=1 Tax=Lachnellula occidentalis TaxID=215460 RepID=A0A8H8S2T2_9HELO|nr:Hybrid signal transduction histidine kinase K [Lachnellula occidentalis]
MDNDHSSKDKADVDVEDKTPRARRNNPTRKIFDWISKPRPQDITPFQKSILDVDWDKSPFGPISTWPIQLKQMVLLVVQDHTPALVFWGDQNNVIYNEYFIPLIGNKHPGLQGQDPYVGLPEIWDRFDELLASQRETGETILERHDCLMLHRHDFLEETYFNWKLIPIIGPEGWVVGSYATVVEVTREVISDRRLSTVRSLSRQLSEASTIQELWKGLITGIQDSAKDIPFALLYSCAPIRGSVESISPQSMLAGQIRCSLEGCAGIARGHVLAPETIELDHEHKHQSELGPYVRKAIEDRAPTLIPIPDTMQPIDWRGYGRATQGVICPIIPANTESALAFLIVALNPRRPFDEDYRSFVHLLTQQITTPQLSAVILHEEIDRRRNVARQEALDRDRLYKELSDSETKFARFASRAPIGLAMLDPNGKVLSANDTWRNLTMLDVGSEQVRWNEVIAEGDLESVLGAWAQMIGDKQPSTIQARMKKQWIAPDLDLNGNPQEGLTHILVALYPDQDERGEVSTVMSCITDISGLKWSETQLRDRMDQAIEMKTQQERFIDMTSHEMRNPLSALIGCADEITTSLTEYISDLKKPLSIENSSADPEMEFQKPLHLLDEAMEAAETIIYCAMHQKRIIDDILTLSRLDSNLLLVSPEPSQPIQLVRGALKMFQAEVKRADVRLDFVEHKSLQLLDINWTLLDPSRVLQVFINLMTNAIKFTRIEAQRHIRITIGASYTRPSVPNEFGVEYIRKNTESQDQTGKQEWGDGEVIYFKIAVTDTGLGLTVEEKKHLFSLFQQASPKTHVQYGGSGLGLFISRQLTEMHGGEIGVASERGKGSTFQFYIKTRRTTPPLTDVPEQANVQLYVREDELREACGVELPALKDEPQISNLKIDDSLSPVSPAAPYFPSSFHILVVEDNLVNQKVVSKQLRKAGHIVDVANHGEEALDCIRQTEYWEDSSGEKGRLDVILMDLEMPVMDGLSCVKRIREHQAQGRIKSHVPVIAVTANARKDQIMASMEAGMDDVMTKPYRMQDMLKQIEALVAKHDRLDSARK